MKTHFPHHLEIVLFLGKALDAQKSTKVIYEKSQDIFTSKKASELFLLEMLSSLEGMIEGAVLDSLKSELWGAVEDYLSLVGSKSAEGVPKQDLKDALLSSYCPIIAARILNRVSDYLNISPVVFTDSSELSVPRAIKLLDSEDSSWLVKQSVKVTKETLDNISSWRRGDNLPQLYSLKSLNAEPRICSILIVARIMDYCRIHLGSNFIDEVRACVFGAQPVIPIDKKLASLRAISQKEISSQFNIVGKIQNGLKRTIRKGQEAKGSTFLALEMLTSCLAGVGWGGTSFNWLYWHRARWHVFNGDLTSASKEYERAVKAALFCAGPNQQYILQEAMAVTSYFEKPNMVLLKGYKKALVTFGYDVESVYIEKDSAKASDHIQDWEIDSWRCLFQKLFPEQGFFPNKEFEFPLLRNNTGPIVVDGVKSASFKKPDRKKTYGSELGKRKKMPQLINAVENEEFEDFLELLNAGADVNVTTKSGDTPIGCALGILSAIDRGASNDPRYFKELVKYPHSPAVINSKSEKKKFTALMLAINTGNAQIVKEVLNLGADANLSIGLDDLSPLYYCMGHIAKALDSDTVYSSLAKQPRYYTDKEANAVRRYTNGLAGTTLDEVRFNLQNQLQSPRAAKFLSSLSEHFTESFSEMDVEELKVICQLLLNAGANPDAVRNNPVRGYTPIMFAAEIGDLELYKILVESGADTSRTYFLQNEGAVDIRRISEFFESKDILHYLNTH